MTLDFSKRDVINMALAMSAQASSSYCDERLTTAATEHHLAARLWCAAGYDAKALHHSTLANAIDQETLDIAAGREAA
jgi:hypothetical protein